MTTTETVKLAVKPLEWKHLAALDVWSAAEGAYWAWQRNGVGYWRRWWPDENKTHTADDQEAAEAAAQADYGARILSALATPAGGEVEPVAARLTTWFNSLPDGGMGKEHFDALLAIVATATPNPSGEAVRVAKERFDQIDCMVWGGQRIQTMAQAFDEMKALARDGSRRMSEALAAPPSPQGVEITEAMIDAALPHLIGTSSKTARPFGRFWPGMTADESENANWRYYGRDRVKAALTAALSPTGRDAE